MSTAEQQTATVGFGDRAVPGYLIVFFGALVAMGPLSMNAYLPAIPSIADDFGVSIVAVNNTLSIFLIGFAFGQFFGGTLSDQIGRKRIGYLGLAIYIATTLAITMVSSVEQMLALRFVQAIGGGFSTVICMATVRDVYPIQELGKRFATVMMIMLVAPLVAPTVGSLLIAFGWQAIFLGVAIYATLLLGFYMRIVPETREGHWRDIALGTLFLQCRDVLTRRINGHLSPARYAVSMALGASVMMNFVTNSSFVYMEYFGATPGQFPFLFAASVLGFMALNTFSMHRLNESNAQTIFRAGLWLQLAGVCMLLLVIALGIDSLWTVVPCIVLIVGTLGLITPAGSARYLGFFSGLAGTASSVYTAMMFIGGGTFGALTGLMFDGTLLPLGLSMLSSALIANLVVLGLPKPSAEHSPTDPA